MESKILDKKRLPIKSLHEFQGDFKTLGKKQFEKLKKSIEKNGFIQPFFIWNKEGQYYILDGHQRKKAIIDLYGDTIDVDCIEIKATSELEAKKFVIYYSSSYAEFDKDSFFNFADGLSFDDLEAFQFPNFSFSENDFLKGLDSEQDDIIPEVAQNELGVKLGDVYALGEHRLMCGDSTDLGTVQRLMYGQKADMVFTDPPYNVDYDNYDRPKPSRTNLGKIKNDKMGDQDFQEFISKILNASFEVTKDDSSLYLWYASSFSHCIFGAFEQSEWKRNQEIILKKPMLLGRGRYQWAHEPCVFAVKGSPWFTDQRDKTTVWDFGGYDKSKNNHPTQKPVFLPEEGIRNSSKIGSIVLDLFGGSGSTLIACEKTKRKCYMMELDPHYCSVIIKRWEKYTGQKAVKCE